MPTPLDRVFEATGCRTQTELAEFLGIRQSSISDAKKRGVIPPEWQLKLLRYKGINPEWVINGKGSKILVGREGIQAHDDGFRLPAVAQIKDFSSQELFNELARRFLG